MISKTGLRWTICRIDEEEENDGGNYDVLNVSMMAALFDYV